MQEQQPLGVRQPTMQPARLLILGGLGVSFLLGASLSFPQKPILGTGQIFVAVLAFYAASFEITRKPITRGSIRLVTLLAAAGIILVIAGFILRS